MIKFFEKAWGNLVLEASFDKVDFLPRLTACAFEHALIFNAGFLFLTLNFTIWSKAIREFNRNNAENR